MTRPLQWLDPVVIKRIRVRISIILWIILLLMLYMNYQWILHAIERVFYTII